MMGLWDNITDFADDTWDAGWDVGGNVAKKTGNYFTTNPVGKILGASLFAAIPGFAPVGAWVGDKVQGVLTKNNQAADAAAKRRDESNRRVVQQWVQQPQKSVSQILADAGMAPAMPDYSGYRTGIGNSYAAKEAALAKFREALPGYFNFGADPQAQANLDWQKRDLAGRLQAADTATARAFLEATQSINASQAKVDPRAAAALAAQVFAESANVTAANNAVSDRGLSNAAGQDVVGIGPISGDAAMAVGSLRDTGAVAGESARAQAQLLSDDLGWLSNTTTALGASRRGTLQNDSQAAYAQAVREFSQREAARIASEREAMRNLELSTVQEGLGLNWQRERELADVTRAEADAKAESKNKMFDFYAKEASEKAANAVDPGMTMTALASAAGAGRDQLRKAWTGLSAASPDFLRQMSQLGVIDADSFYDLWKSGSLPGPRATTQGARRRTGGSAFVRPV
jgi:hypothetical protein